MNARLRDALRRARETASRAAVALGAPPTRRARRATYALLGALVVAAWVAHARHFSPPAFPVDDPYITLHNAQALRAGHDPNYPGVSPLTGATSAAHLALVWALLHVAPSPLRALDAAGWLAAVAYALGLARLAFVHRASVARAWLLVAAGLLVARTPHQLANGLETGLALAALAWALAAFDDPLPRRWFVLPALCGALPFVRPELALASALLLGARAVRAALREGARAAARGLARDAAVCALAAAPWLAWYALATGSPVPSSVATKRLFFAEGCHPAELKREWVARMLALFAVTIGYATRAWLLGVASAVGRVGLLFAAGFVATYYAQFPGALGHNEQRYLYVTLPFLFAGVAACLAHARRWVRVVATVALVAALDESLLALPSRLREYARSRAHLAAELEGVAAWARAHLPRDARLLVHDAGYISFATRFAVVDLVGLKSPSSVPHHAAITWPTCGRDRGEAVHRIALAARPTHFVALTGWDGLYRFVDALRARGWGVVDVRGAGDYRVYRLTPPAPRPPGR